MKIEELERKFKEYELEPLFEYLKKYSKNAISLNPEQMEDSGIEIGVTKFGGLPDLPIDTEWFINEESKKTLGFIAQINFSEIKDFDLENKLPQKGMLYLFYDMEEMPWGYDPKDKTGKKVFYYFGNSPLERKQRPHNLEDDFLLNSYKLNFDNTIEIPDYWSSLADFELSEEENERYWELKEDFAEKQNKVLGHSNNIQDGMELQCELVSNGLYCGDSSAYESEQRKELEKNIYDWELLLQIDSNDDFMWGDDGRIYLWIKKDDLKNKKFENSWLILQCY